MKVTIINFSGRMNGNCQSIAKIIKEYYKPSEVHFYDCVTMDIHSCGRCQYECMKIDHKACPHINDFVYDAYENISNSDITYYIVPNYQCTPNANYFAFKERCVCFMWGHPEKDEQYTNAKKKFVVTNCNENDRDDFIKFFQFHASQPDIFFVEAKKYNKKSTGVDLTKSEDFLSDLKEFMKEN